jgi:hypothetical protein
LSDTVIILNGYDLYERFFPLERNYFPFISAIIVFSSAALLLTILFDTGDDHFLTEGEQSFTSSNDKTTMNRVILVLCFIIGMSMITSAQYFVLIASEPCLKSQDFSDTFCEKLESLNVNVRSVIYPTSLAVNNYQLLVILLASCLFLSCMYKAFRRTVVSNSMSIQENSTNISSRSVMGARNQRINSFSAYLIFNNLVNQNSVANGRFGRNRTFGRHNRVYAVTNNGDDIESEPYVTNESNLSGSDPLEWVSSHVNMVSKWKFSRYAPSNNARECPICLGSLPLLKPTKGKVSSSNYIRTIEDGDNTSAGEIVDTNTDRLDAAGDAEGVVTIPCGHVFHRDCIIEWSRSSYNRRAQANQIQGVSCPVCRADLE